MMIPFLTGLKPKGMISDTLKIRSTSQRFLSDEKTHEDSIVLFYRS